MENNEQKPDIEKKIEKKPVKITTQSQALEVLVQAVNVGQSKGCYSLKDASLIYQAIEMFSVENKS